MRSPSPFGSACRVRGTVTAGSGSGAPREAGEEVAELRLLGPEVIDVAGMRHHLERRTRDDVDPVRLEPDELLRVVGEQPHAPDAEVAQDLRPDAVVPEVFLEAELEVRLDRVASLVLERVRADLVGEPDAAPLLVQVHDDTPSGGRDLLERLPELVATIAPFGAEDVARETLGMQPDEHVGVGLHVAEHERHVLMLIDRVVVDDGAAGRPGVASSATAARTVVARSDALMPVETPCRASMETPYAGSGRIGSADINGMPSCRMRSRVSTRQTRPRPCVTMKLMTSGVTRAALHASTASGGSLALSTISRSPPARSCSRHSGLRSAFTGGRVPRDPTRGKGPSGFTRPAVPEPRRRDPARRARRRRRRAGSRP